MLLYLGGFKPNMLPVAPQKMPLGGYNQMFMISRIVSSDDKILSKKSSELGDITSKMGQVNGSYSSIKGIFRSKSTKAISIAWYDTSIAYKGCGITKFPSRESFFNDPTLMY